MSAWLDKNWPQCVTWALIILGWFVGSITAWAIAKRNGKTNRHDGHVDKIVDRIDDIEGYATSYWTRGRQAPSEDSELENKILSGIDRIESEIEELLAPAVPREETIDAIVRFRRSITNDPFQSASRVAIPSHDERLSEIASASRDLARNVRKLKKT